MLTAEPALLEPVYLCDITCPQNAMGGIYGCLTQRRGHIFEESQQPGSPIMNLKGYLPVSESFGFTAALRSCTGGKAFPQCVFDHWEVMTGDAYDEGSKLYNVVRKIRERKGINPDIPPLSRYLDKL